MKVTMMVVDEADQMIDTAGFGEDTVAIKRGINPRAQILLFSATFPERVVKFAEVVAPRAVWMRVKTEELSLDNIHQFYMDCKSETQKYQVLTDIYTFLTMGQSIIFVHTVKTAKFLAKKLREGGFPVSLLHGKDMEHSERDRVMDDFRSGATTVLISTNVLARGIDVLQVTLVVNYDLPLTRENTPDYETYIHRIGRTGRFGKSGVAINMVHNDVSKRQLLAIGSHFSKNICELPTDPSQLEQVTTAIQDALGTLPRSLHGQAPPPSGGAPGGPSVPSTSPSAAHPLAR